MNWYADTMGELGLFFRLCPISFMGKSLVDLGGQNPIEPARLESAILFGPHMWNFPDIAERLLGSGGARNVMDSNDLADAVSTLLGHDEKRLASIAIARTIADSETQVLASVLDVLQPFVTAISEKNEAP